MTRTDIEAETLVTKGIKSPVLTHERGRLKGIGHVALFDWDDHAGDNPHALTNVLHSEHVGGPTVVWESSEGSYHGWNLAVRGFADTAMALDDGMDDRKHLSVGENRGWWRLRAGPKAWVDSREHYKPPPEYRHLEGNIRMDSDIIGVSRPHAEVSAALSGEDIVSMVESATPNRVRWVGDTLMTAMYATFTDREKSVRRNVV